MKKIIAFTLLTASFSACAAFDSGNTLLANLISKDANERLYAFGYVAGIHDYHQGENVCTTAGVTMRQVSDIVLKKLQDKPELRHMSADVFVFVALKEAFPCAKKKAT